MVREDGLQSILSSAGSLDRAVDMLVKEANRMGGRDNITVILFRLGGEGDSEPGRGAMEPDTREHKVPEQTATDMEALEPPIAVAPDATSKDAQKAAGAAGTAVADVTPPPVRPPPRAPAPRRGRRRRRRLRAALVTLAVLVVLGGLGAGATAGIRSVYFVGQNDRGLVTLYRGVPYELPADIKLYSTEYVSSVQTQTLRPFERRRLLDHELRSRDDAAKLIRDLEQGR
jgi:protein phosphatase